MGRTRNVVDREVVYLGHAFPRLFPVVHAGALYGRLIAHHLQSGHHLCDAAFVYQILRRAGHDEMDELFCEGLSFIY